MTVRNRAIFDISMSAFLWGLPPLLIHYFAGYLDAHTQNFWRYASAVVFLWIYGWKTGQPLFSGRVAPLLRTLPTAALVVIYQCGFTLSLYYALPALISLLIQLSLVVAIVLSCIFFADERRVVRSPWFLAGACAALGGAVGMVVFSRQFFAAQSQPAEWRSMAIAVVLISVAAVFWGAYSVAIKWCMRVLPPYPAFANVATFATLGFFALTLLRGKIGAFFQMPTAAGIALILSGVGCIGIAHIFYARAIRQLGVGICNTVILTSPIVASIGSWVFFHERFTALQLASALVLLGGAAAAIRANGR